MDKVEEIIPHVLATVNNPLEFVQNAYPWGEEGTTLAERKIEKWQRECLDALGKEIRRKEKINPNNYVIRLAVKSGQGVGKTTDICWIIQWFLSTRKNPHCIVTANTENQLKNVVWRELSKWHSLLFNKDLFNWTATTFSLKESPEKWRAVAVPYNESRPEAFQGIHAEDVLIIFDEASGIPEIIWNVIEGTIKTGRCILIAFSNPTKNSGSFREAFGKNSHRWINYTVDSREVSFANQEEFEQDIKDYGEDSDYVRVRIKGEFPRIGSQQVVSSEVITRCIKYEERFYHDFVVMIGVDVARFGDDESVICIRQGRKVHNFFTYRGLNGKKLAEKVVEQCIYWKTRTIFVDGIGVGASPYDFLEHFGYSPIDVQGAESANEPHKYLNRRAEMYIKMQKAMNENIDLPDNEISKRFKEQLETVNYDYTNNMRLYIDKKSEIKKRGMGSPDLPDALALTFSFDICKLKEENCNNNITVSRIKNKDLTKLKRWE